MTTETIQDQTVRPGLLPLLAERRSVRTYDAGHRLADEELRLLLEAARWAPSAGNSQPWAFLVGRRGDAAHDGFVELLSRGNRSWAPAASALLFTAHQVASGPEEDAPDYSDYALYDLGQAVAHLTVQAQALGLVAHQFAGFDHDALAAAAGVPRHWRVTTGIAVGRELAGAVPDERRPRTRRPQEAFAFGGTWGRPLDQELD
ncbi:MAG: nitroreductase family protein [Nocardioides sp.]